MNESREGVHGMADSTDQLALTDVVAFFRRNFKLIAGFVIAFGVVASVVLLLVVEKQYEASVTLVIVPPKLASELKPQSLSVQSYQKILESDAVLAETRRRLGEKGFFPSRMDFQVGQALKSRIFVSRLREDIALAPMLQAVVHAKSAEEAAATANIWAEVFLSRVRELVAGSTSSAVQFVEQQYPGVRDDLAKAEEQRVDLAGSLQERYDDASTSWDSRLAAYKSETADLAAAFNSETERLVREFASAHNLDTRHEQIAALRKAYADLQGDQALVSSSLQEKKLRLDGITATLAKTPEYLTLQKAISDDALWQAMGKAGEPTDWKALQGRALTTQVPNPVYQELATRAAMVEADVAALVPRGAQLEKELGELSGNLKSLEMGVANDESQSEKLKFTRTAELTRLQEGRAAGLAAMGRQRDRALAALKLETDARLGGLDRTIGQQRELFSQLSKSYNQAILAKGQQDFEDVRVGAAAVPNPLPLRRNRLLKAALVAAVGGILGIGAAVIREADRRSRTRRGTARDQVREA